MTQYRLTDSAKQDIEDIVDYSLVRWGKERTIKYLNELNDKLLILKNNPHIGTLRSDINPSLISFPVKSHMIYYFKKDEEITIVRILHKHTCYKLRKFLVKKD